MNRPAALAVLAAYLSEEEDDELIFLPPEILQYIETTDLPVGALVGVGIPKPGNVTELVDNIRLVRHDGATTRAVVDHDIWPKYWPEAVGARFYLDILHKCVLSNATKMTDLAIDNFDDSDTVAIFLEYSFPINGTNLAGAFVEAKQIRDNIESPAQHILGDVTRTLARSVDGLLRGHYAQISELVAQVESANSAADKGSSLELLMAALFEQLPGFTVYDRNTRTESEEIDLIVLNGSNDPVYGKDGPIILVECKNWTAKAGRPEFSLLETKMRNRRGRCTIAYFVSWSGFTEVIQREALRLSRENYVIVCLTGDDIRRAALAGKFVEFMREVTLRAINS